MDNEQFSAMAIAFFSEPETRRTRLQLAKYCGMSHAGLNAQLTGYAPLKPHIRAKLERLMEEIVQGSEIRAA